MDEGWRLCKSSEVVAGLRRKAIENLLCIKNKLGRFKILEKV